MASNAPVIEEGPLLTADGTPLKVSLQRSQRQNRNRAIMLVAPPLLFLVFVFVIPIGDMLLKSVDDKLINEVLPRTFEAFEAWDKQSDPDEAMFEAPVAGAPQGSVIQVIQTGYRLHDRLLRPARVGIAKGGAEAPAESAAKGNGAEAAAPGSTVDTSA